MNGKSETPNVTIIGRPNVGKSELFNRLIGRKIAIVHDQPGVTRDRLSAVCTRGNRSFRLWDTGGIWGAGESELARLLRKSHKPIVLVINKVDHPNHESLASDFAALGFDNTVSVSAAHGR